VFCYSQCLLLYYSRDDAQVKKSALKEKTEKEIVQYNLELKVCMYKLVCACFSGFCKRSKNSVALVKSCEIKGCEQEMNTVKMPIINIIVTISWYSIPDWLSPCNSVADIAISFYPLTITTACTYGRLL